MNCRSTSLILCLIVIVAVGVLAASLGDAHFEPGRSVAAPAGAQTAVSLPALDIPSDAPVWKLLLLWLVFVINLGLLIMLLPPEARKRLLRQAISLALGMLALLFALRYRVIHLPEIEAPPAGNDRGRPWAARGCGKRARLPATPAIPVDDVPHQPFSALGCRDWRLAPAIDGGDAD